jgi:hypothetical protein
MNTIEQTERPAELEGLTLDIRYDNVFKAVFADEADPRSRTALSGLLSAIVGRTLTAERVLQNEPVTGFLGEKQIRYDINCACNDGTQRNMPFGGLVRIFTAELPKVETLARSKPVREMTSVERWATYFLYNADESEFARDLIEEIKKKEEGIRMAAEVVHEYTADEKIYYRLLSEMKYEMDHRNRMLDAEERGEKRGEERGRAEEREKAEAKMLAAVDALRAAGVSEEIIERAYPRTGL